MTVAASTGSSRPSTTKTVQKKSNSQSISRPTLIPRRFILTINDDRIGSIFKELQRLKVDDFPNAVAVLFRVFLELSLDRFIGQKQLTHVNQNSKLRDKLDASAKYLKANQRLTDQQLMPVQRAVADTRLLASSVTTFHQYVHNAHFSPISTDLKVAWNDLQPFIEQISM